MVAHLALIMDGSRRWAQRQGLTSYEGHQAGAQALRPLITFAAQSQLTHLSLYAFSTENWRRSAAEVSGIFRLMCHMLRSAIDDLYANGVQVVTVGSVAQLPEELQTLLTTCTSRTVANPKLTLIVALNYGGRDEIVRATRAIAQQCVAQKLQVEQIDARCIASHLDTAGYPDPELIIRTGGMARLSNFYLWQSSYSELFFTETLWPDFQPEECAKILERYHTIPRNFGGDSG